MRDRKPQIDPEDYEATYCPEDNKLRLYIGWCSRPEFERLRAEGWTATPKQDCSFAATWTPERRDTCLEYAGYIGDEDQSPQERAADRAERFGGYRDKRLGEAGTHAASFEAGPAVHGYQSQARADRAARRHDKIAARAVDSWEKAEYWTRRTAGVISHALYKSRPDVRMGRIKELEALIRKHEAEVKQARAVFERWQKVAAITDTAEQTARAITVAGSSHSWFEYTHPRAAELPEDHFYKSRATSIWHLLTMKENPITGAEACALFFSNHSEPTEEGPWLTHYRLRLAYELQMLDEQGGRAAFVEMEVGGTFGGHVIAKINKSTATGRVVSVSIVGKRFEGWCYKGTNVPGTDYALHQFDTERASTESYKPPTPESLAKLAEFEKAKKDAQKKYKEAHPTIPLINPTDEDAERLQAIWNERERTAHEAKNIWKSEAARASHSAGFVPARVVRITQEVYSRNSKGVYGSAETRLLHADAELAERDSNMYSSHTEERRKRIGPGLCKIRRTGGGKGVCGWSFDSVIVITDKPQKPLPAAVWEKYAPATAITEEVKP